MNSLDIITRSLKKIGVVAGDALPRPREQDDALQTLKSIYSNWVASGAFGLIEDVIPRTDTYTAGENQRITVFADSVCEITMPEFIETCDGFRPIRHGAVVRIINHATTEIRSYIRDANVSLWCDIDALTLTSEAPFSSQDANGLAAMLALILSDEYGQTASPTVTAQAMAFQHNLIHNWSQAQPSTRIDYF